MANCKKIYEDTDFEKKKNIRLQKRRRSNKPSRRLIYTFIYTCIKGHYDPKISKNNEFKQTYRESKARDEITRKKNKSNRRNRYSSTHETYKQCKTQETFRFKIH